MEHRLSKAERVSAILLFIGCTLTYTLLSLQKAGGSLMFLTKPVGILTALFAAFILIKYKFFPLKIYPELWLYGLYIAFASIPGLMIAPSRSQHIDMAIRLAQGFGIIVSVFALTGLTRSIKPMLYMLAAGCLIFALYGVISGTLKWYRFDRWSIGEINPNLFARVPLFGLLSCIGLIGDAKDLKKRIAFCVLAAAFAYLLFVSGSRTAYIALLAGALIYLVLTGRDKDRRRFYLRRVLPACAVLGVLALAAIYIKNPSLFKGFFARVTMFFSDGNSSTSSRLGAIKEALSRFLQSPVFGIGAYQFSAISADGLNHCHCDAVELLMAFGLTGFALYVSAGCFGIRGIYRSLRFGPVSKIGSAAATAALAAAYILLGLGDITIYEMNGQFVWGTVLACSMLWRIRGSAA